IRDATFCHPAGSVAMGKAVDTILRAKGVDGLRVVDASVLPLSVRGHYQAVVYGGYSVRLSCPE
ncbi:hypothetical protein BO71DRAFT_331382, partial [Aspergillus ellipticus CBS 707.79]